ncbi:TIGR03086 family metal-binding protein [soil metagenome]
MQGHTLVAAAAAPTENVVRRIRVDQLDAPTPCSEFAVRDLVNHLLFWGPALEGAGRKEPVAPTGPDERSVDLSRDDWAAALESQIDRIVEAWGDQRAWEGTTRFGSPEEVPASMIGGMACTELVLHGWDLARATGQEPDWGEEVAAFVDRELTRTAAQGREMGIYGPAVAVPDTATTLERALGLSGRDPRWAP